MKKPIYIQDDYVRKLIGLPKTVGEMRNALSHFPNKTPLMVRNGPLPTIYDTTFDEINYCEI